MQWARICSLPQGYRPSERPRLLLTGANGLLGQAVLRAVSEELTDWTIVASSYGPPRSLSYTVPYVSVDITDSNVFGAVVSTLSPTYVLHTAAMTKVDVCEERKKEAHACNLQAVETLLSTVSSECFLLLLSTDFVFDGMQNPYDETAKYAPCNYYGLTKKLAEERLRTSGRSWAVVRTSLVYGIEESPKKVPFLSWVRKDLARGQQLQMLNDQRRRPTFVDDLAVACLRILQRKKEGIFHITGEEELTPYEMVRKAASYWGYDETLVQLTDTLRLAQRATRPRRTLLDIEKAKQVLSYRPRSFLQALRDMDKY